MKTTRTWSAVCLATVTSLVLAGCGGSGFEEEGGDSEQSGSGGEITVLIGSSGDAETQAVRDAVAAWSEESGTQAEVTLASDLNQQLSQGFAASTPPDVFYLSADQMAGYAANGSLEPYGDDLPNKDGFYPTLVEAFSVDGALQCAPKDFSTLALVINQRLWKEAGLTEADVPTTWDELESVAQQLTEGKVVGLTMSPEYARVGAFFPAAGGSMTNEEGTEATVDSPENLEALQYVQSMMQDGTLKYSSELGAGWGGEAFGKELAAMTIEGNWIAGALTADFPDVDWLAAELPEGPAGPGTLAFTNCWGVAAAGNTEAAVSLVEHLTTEEQQIEFANAFGVIPSLQSAAEQWASENPRFEPFVVGADYAQNPPGQQGTADVIADFNAQLETLRDGDPQGILSSVQETMQAALDAQG